MRLERLFFILLAIFYSSSNLETFDLCEQIFVLAQIHIEALRFDEGLATLQEVER